MYIRLYIYIYHYTIQSLYISWTGYMNLHVLYPIFLSKACIKLYSRNVRFRTLDLELWGAYGPLVLASAEDMGAPVF